MFRRLADHVSSVVASVAGNGTAEGSDPVARLTGMGFSSADARHALQVSGNNVEQAADWLLSNGGVQSNSVAMVATSSRIEEDELQKAICASLEEAGATRSNHPPNITTQSATSKRAGEAALARLGKNRGKDSKAATKKSAIQSHPNVKVPKGMSQCEKEDAILRCAQRVAPNTAAVDTLLKSLKQLQQNSTNLKFRTIDTSTPGFKRSLDVPGTLDFFKAMGYHTSRGNENVLELSYVDPAAFYIGISALEQIQQTSVEYQRNKAQIVFDKEVQQIIAQADQDMQEALKRSQFISKLPSEPTMGGGFITVELGSSSKIQRKFDGDDCLQDVLNWLGANGSVIPQKLENHEWYLTNRNHANAVAYNVTALKGKTLQYIGCWPSGRLAIVPVPPSTTEYPQNSSRGLGAAPIEALSIL